MIIPPITTLLISWARFVRFSWSADNASTAAFKDISPEERAESAAQVFLGIRLQCAKCHNHPFDRWTQDDYFGWTNFFARVDYKIVENKRRDENDKHEFNGEQIVLMKDKGDVTKKSDVNFA